MSPCLALSGTAILAIVSQTLQSAMKLILNPWFPYASSVAIHALAWGACCVSAWCWFSKPELQLSRQRGDALETTLVLGSAAASPAPSIASELQAPDAPSELAETAVAVIFGASSAPSGAELSAGELATERMVADARAIHNDPIVLEDQQPASSSALDQPALPASATKGSATPPTPNSAAAAEPASGRPLPRRPGQHQISTSVSVAMPSQAAQQRGVVDGLPQKLSGNEEPRWPRAAWLAGAEGRVVLRVVVEADGTASEVEVSTSSGRDDFDAAALAAVRRWRFSPARRYGNPVDYAVLVPIRFSLRRG
jgi:protein TonB